jgi:meiosis-specific transcription factor NDT80
MLMYDSSHRGGLSYGRTDYRQMPGAEQSPLGDSPPLVSSSSSSGFDYMVNETMHPSEVDLGQHQYVGGPNNHRTNMGGFDPVHSAYNGYGTIGNSRGVCI